MRRIDATTIDQRGVPGIELMRRAGLAVAREAMQRYEPDAVAILTGKGNNAGDGFIAAAELAGQGVRVRLYALRAADELSGDALTAWRELPDSVERIEGAEPDRLRAELPDFDLAIDAMFGTGLSGPARAPWPEYFAALNESPTPVLAVDVPSGLPGDPGGDTGPHVRAHTTLTIGLPKLGLVLDPGAAATGTVVVADIGFPRDLLESPELTVNLLTLETMRRALPRRDPAGHKGTFGRVLLLGGSEGMTGAAILAGRAAARSGVGLVYVAYPRGLAGVIEANLIEPVKRPLPGDARHFDVGQAAAVLEQAREVDAVAIGPGLGRAQGTGAFVRAVVEGVETPLIMDADALNLLAEDPDMLTRRPGPTLLTPHPGEAGRLLGRSTADVEADRLGAFVDWSARYGVWTALKGSRTIVTAPDGQRFINPTGNSGLAKGGSGDVLTGLVAGLAAQGVEPGEALRLGVFLHGMAGDLAAREHGVRAMLPADVIEHIGPAFMKLEQAED